MLQESVLLQGAMQGSPLSFFFLPQARRGYAALDLQNAGANLCANLLPEMLPPKGKSMVQEEDPSAVVMYPMGQSEHANAGLMVELRYVFAGQFWA